MVRVTLIGQTTSEATKQEQQFLNLSAGDLVLRTAQVKHDDDGPVRFEQIVLPLGRFPGIAPDGQHMTDVFELARQHKLTLGLARERIRNVRAGVQVATHLNVTEGTRLLRLDRVVHTSDGIPIEWRVSFSLPIR